MSKQNTEKNNAALIGGVFCAIIAIIVIFITNLNKPKEEMEETISTTEAQKKCVVMEMVDIWQTGGDRDTVVETARKHCLESWNTPEKEKIFRKTIQDDWNNRKNEVFEGETLEDFYNSIEGDI